MASFKIDIKPTNHKQRCCICNAFLIKGSVRIAMIWQIYRQSDSMYAHPDCLIKHIKTKWLKILTESPKFKDSFNPSKRDEFQ